MCERWPADGCDAEGRRSRLEALHEKERLLSLAEQVAQVGHWRITYPERLYRWSDEVYRIHGREPGRFAPNPDDALAAYHPHDRGRVAAHFVAAVKSGEGFTFQARLVRPSGETRWVLARAVCERDGGSRTAAIFGVLMDVTDLVRAQAEVRGNAARNREILDAALDAFVAVDAAGLITAWNTAAEAIFGWPASEAIGLPLTDTIIPPSARAGHQAGMDRALRTGDRRLIGKRLELTAAHRDGRIFPIEIAISETEVDGVVAFNAFIRDISERKARERALQESEAALRTSEERLALAVDSGSDGMWDWDVATGGMWLSDQWQAMLGYAPGELEGHVRTWERLIHPDDRDGAVALLTEHFEGRSAAYECEHRLLRKDGGWGWVLARGKVVARDGTGRPLRIVGTHIDTTERREAERRIEHMARHDGLTGLANRALLRDRLGAALARAAFGDGGGCVALLLVDLDRFKAVNDALGHQAGDALLCEVARRLRGVASAGDTVARLGGDEFAIVCGPAGTSDVSVRELASRVVAALAEAVELEGGLHRVVVGASVGLALCPRDGATVDDLFRKADLALFRAKADGRSTYRAYEPAMDAAADARRRLDLDLRRALARGEFEVHYQPVQDAATGRTCGAEALVRWRHPVRGLVSPTAFVPLAEESGLIVPIGEWVLREACRQACLWPDRDRRVAVNISAVQFRGGGLVPAVTAALADSGLRPDRLELEITETVLMGDGEEVCAALHALRRLGVRIALDDFGTGYSSLSYLRRFPFDKIKIDRSFVAGIRDPGTAAIVRAIVGLGRQLGMAVTAEGVETEEQLRLVREERCTEVQGYLIGRPRPADDPAGAAVRADLAACAA